MQVLVQNPSSRCPARPRALRLDSKLLPAFVSVLTNPEFSRENARLCPTPVLDDQSFCTCWGMPLTPRIFTAVAKLHTEPFRWATKVRQASGKKATVRILEVQTIIRQVINTCCRPQTAQSAECSSQHDRVLLREPPRPSYQRRQCASVQPRLRAEHQRGSKIWEYRADPANRRSFCEATAETTGIFCE